MIDKDFVDTVQRNAVSQETSTDLQTAARTGFSGVKETLQDLRRRLAEPTARPGLWAAGYLAWLTVAELVSSVGEPRVGLLLHVGLLIALIYHAARDLNDPLHQLLLTLAFAPLIRLISFSLPLASFPQVAWYFIVSLPLFVAAYLVYRVLGFTRASIGLRIGSLPMQALIGLTGLTLGYVEYRILTPAPLAPTFTWQELWLPALVLLISTGFLEELIFRGLMQHATKQALGRVASILYVSVVFAVLHFGYKSLLDVIFVFVVAVFFGWIVARTNSLLGVTLAHGLTNIMLFLVMPYLASG
jgi:membrane protease YdiL (CAAX protease family)